jgi:hypothetical protein
MSSSMTGSDSSLPAASNVAYTTGSVSDATASASSFRTTNPRPQDVKCGQDKSFEKHHGNIVLRNIIIASVPTYKTMMNMKGKAGKTDIIRCIVSRMQTEYGSRFICFNKDGKYWEEIKPHLARDKVSHAIRTVIKKEKNKLKATKQLYPAAELTPSINRSIAGSEQSVASCNTTSNGVAFGGKSCVDENDYSDYDESTDDQSSRIASSYSCNPDLKCSPCKSTFSEKNEVRVVTTSVQPQNFLNSFDQLHDDAFATINYCNYVTNGQSLLVATKNDDVRDEIVEEDPVSARTLTYSQYDPVPVDFQQGNNAAATSRNVPLEAVDNHFDTENITLDDAKYLAFWLPDEINALGDYDVNEEYNIALDRLSDEK